MLFETKAYFGGDDDDALLTVHCTLWRRSFFLSFFCLTNNRTFDQINEN